MKLSSTEIWRGICEVGYTSVRKLKKQLIIIVLFFCVRLNIAWGASYTWSIAATSTSWSLVTNWGGLAYPSAAADNVTIVSGTLFNPKLDITRSLTNFTMTSGSLDLNGQTLTITGTAAFNGGTITNGTLIVSGASTTFAGTIFSASCTVTVTSADVYLNGSTFNGTTTINKTGATANNGNGGNTFAGTTLITNSGTGQFRLANSTADTYNGAVTFTSSSSGGIYPAYNGANAFNNNIVVNNTGTGGIQFGGGTGTSTLAATKTITIGASGFTAGTLLLKNFTQTGATSQSLTLTTSGTLTIGPASSFGGNFTASSPSLLLNGCTYSGTSSFTKTGSTNDACNGGNTFTGACTFTNNSSGYIVMGNVSPDIFNGATTINNPGTNTIYMSFFSSGNQFNNTLTINNNGSGAANCTTFGEAASSVTFASTVTINNTSTSGLVRFNVVGTSTFNGNIVMNSTSTTNGIYFSYPGYAGTATLASGSTISVGGTGFTAGNLYFTNFTQSGATAQTLTLSGTAALYFGAGNIFNGDITATTPTLYLNGSRFNSTASITKTGTTNDLGVGGNTFVGAVTIANSGTGNLALSNASADTYTDNVTFTNTGSAAILPSYTAGTTQFNGNIIVNSTSGLGVQFGYNGGLSTLATAKTISVGATGFTTGVLLLKKFTQAGSTAQSITLTGTGILTYGPSSTFNGNVTSVSPQIYLNGCSFAGTTNITKNGATDNSSDGGNTFTGVSTINSNGTGYFLLANINPDIFNADVTFNNTYLLYVAFNAVGNQFNGNVTFNNTGTSGIFSNAFTAATCAYNGNITVNSTSGLGVQFGFFTGTATLANTKTVSVGGSGFTAGSLVFKNFTQLGTTPQNLTLTGSATMIVGSNSTFNANVNFKSPAMLLNGCTYNGTATLEKTGSSADVSSGGNIFNGVTQFTNSGSGLEALASGSPDIYNAATTFICSGTNYTAVGYNSAGNQFNSNVTFTNAGTTASNYLYISCIAGSTVAFNGNIVVNNTNVSSISGVYIGGNGSATLATGKTISVGASGFAAGVLRLQLFTQNGSTAQTITTTGTALLQLGPTSTFNGTLDFTSPQVTLQTTTFNGTTTIEKSGATNNNSAGGNVFNGTTIIKNSGSGYFLLALSASDDYNANVTFQNTGSNTIYPAYGNFVNTFSNNITVTSSSSMVFGLLGGTVLMDGSTAQAISGSTGVPVFGILKINNSGVSNVVLNTPITVSTNINFVSGRLITTSVNLLSISNGGTATGANDNSYVEGPVSKVGVNAFTFPTGKNFLYRPISMSAPGSATDVFTAEYFNINPAMGGYPRNQKDASIGNVSKCEYWNTSGTSTITFTPSWSTYGTVGCSGVTIPAELMVIYWNGSKWKDLGASGYTGTAAAGTVTALTASSVFGPISIGSVGALPIKLLSFTARYEAPFTAIRWSTATEENSDYFEVEKSSDGVNYSVINTLKAAGSSSVRKDYLADDKTNLGGTTYYRLKQVNFDGSFEYIGPVSVSTPAKNKIVLYPNPSQGNDLQITLPAAQGQVSIQVSDGLGRIYFSHLFEDTSGNAIKLDFSSPLPGGIYFVIVASPTFSGIEKLIVRE